MTAEILREYLTCLGSKVITEAIDYAGMFNSIINSFPDDSSKERASSDVKTNIKWAKRILRKNDRIVWYLHWYRLSLLKNEITNNPSNIPDKLKKIIAKLVYNNDANLEFITDSRYSMSRLKTTLEHFISLESVQEIQNYVWNKRESIDDLIRNFHSYEKEWQEQMSGMVEIQENDRELIKIGNQSWWLLDRTTCSAEGEAMGHCGNVGSPTEGERILSFRTHVDKNLWKPHLTFILDNNGYIGESKGRTNEKPAEKYHPAIIELLKNDIITGITGGGYLPEENFEMTDLTTEQQEELYELKFGLAPLNIMYKRSEPKDYIVVANRIKRMFDNIGLDYISYNESSQLFYITKFKNVGELIGNIGNRVANHVWAEMQGSESDYTEQYYNISSDEIKDFFDAMPQKIEYEVIARLEKQFPKEFNELDRDIFDTAKEYDRDLYNIADRAINTGLITGAQVAMFNGLKDAVDNPQNGTVIIDGDFYDSEVYFAYTLKELVHVLSDEEQWSEIQNTLDIIDLEGDGQVIELDEPHYGWEGYDQEVAFEYFHNDL